MTSYSIKTLVLFAQYAESLSYFDDWKDAFTGSKLFNVTTLNICDSRTLTTVKKTIRQYEFIVLLHSTNGDSLHYIIKLEGLLKNRSCPLLSFVGNEVNLPGSSLCDKISFLRSIEAQFIGTQLILEAGQWLYKECNKSRVISNPHALNPNAFSPKAPLNDRAIDIGVCSHKYMPHLGDDDRNKIFNFFTGHAFVPPLVLDIRTNSRFNRDGWNNFLNQCKGTISTEAGSFYLERDDRTVRQIQTYLTEKQQKLGNRIIQGKSSHQKIWASLSPGIRFFIKKTFKNIFKITTTGDLNRTMDFNEIYHLFFKDRAKAPVYSKAISSRHFDAIGTKTCQIMFRGRFNDILQADKHYIALNDDFSNINDVMSRFHDKGYRRDMVDRTYEYVLNQHTYDHRIRYIYKIVSST